MTSCFFIVYSLCFSILLSVIYFNKKWIKTLENNIYSTLMFLNLISNISLVISYFTNIYSEQLPLINHIVLKTTLFFYFSWNTFFFIYNLLSIKKIKKQEIKNKKKLLIGYLIASYIIVNFFDDYFLIVSIIYSLICFIKLVLNIKKISIKEIPNIVFTIFIVISIFIKQYIPLQALFLFMQTLITYMMYFLIDKKDANLVHELNLAKKQLERANIAKTEFLSNMSHEIRTPLNAITGLSQVLLNENISNKAKEDVKEILSASLNLLEIVNSVLDISKIESNKLEIVNSEYNFYSIFEELVSLIKTRVDNKEVAIKSNISKNIPTILYGDGLRVKQIILNLLTNSVKYTKKGVIEFDVDCINEKDICNLIVHVKDTGIGIRNEDLNRLFNKFERFDIKKNISIEGVGLGLAITKKLVDLMNGEIIAQSIYGEGSCFTVKLKQKVVNVETIYIEEDNTKINGTNKKILIVDDNVINLKVANKILSTYGFINTCVSSGRECIELIEQGNKYDLIFLDDMMPEMSGVETLKELKLNTEFNTPVVALTANAISGMREKYLNDGFNEYLSKPINISELEKIIKKLL